MKRGEGGGKGKEKISELEEKIMKEKGLKEKETK